jgi:hypothetical protein
VDQIMPERDISRLGGLLHRDDGGAARPLPLAGLGPAVLRRRRVLVYDYGVLDARSGRCDMYTWSDVASVIERRRRHPLTGTRVEVRLTDGRTFSYPSSKSTTLLLDRVVAGMIPRVRSALIAGETVEFGPVQVSARLAHFPGRRTGLSWVDIHDVAADRHAVVFVTNGGVFRIARYRVTNCATLVAIASALVR